MARNELLMHSSFSELRTKCIFNSYLIPAVTHARILVFFWLCDIERFLFWWERLQMGTKKKKHRHYFKIISVLWHYISTNKPDSKWEASLLVITNINKFGLSYNWIAISYQAQYIILDNLFQTRAPKISAEFQ